MKLKLLGLTLALQMAWLLGTVVTQEAALARGQVIRLETQPVDPRDLLRGDYLVLRYTVNTVPRERFSPPLTQALPYGETVWIALSRRGEFHEVVRASRERFEPAAAEVLLKAQTTGGRPQRESETVHYGLEQYYVREGTGNPRGKITVEAVVPASGRARIKQVFLDGRPYAEVMKEHSQ
jgi:uncharacterized membrane-anchored protein